jgi:lysyl-tRNA synthetase class 2
MIYSLPRFRFLKPSPPFSLGGRFLRQENRHFLFDALGAVEVFASPSLFASLNNGDLVVMQVSKADEAGLLVTEVRREVKSQGPFGSPPKPHAAKFGAFVEQIRRFFRERQLAEVLTPSLVSCPGLEPTLEPFATQILWERKARPAYLPTSPEIHLKKAMALGFSDCFEIKNCFRQGEFSAHHEPEFLMLEWYRGFADLRQIAVDLGDLIEFLCRENGFDPPGEFVETDFAKLFLRHFDFRLTPKTTAEELRELCVRQGVPTDGSDSFNDLFHRLLIERLDGEIARLGAVIIRRFPPSQAALAKLDADGWADRFEFYWNGLEIANAFHEVNDPEEQIERWSEEQRERERLGRSYLPQDPELIQALRHGMPPAGGIALGVERLYMACAGVDDLKELRLFSPRALL